MQDTRPAALWTGSAEEERGQLPRMHGLKLDHILRAKLARVCKKTRYDLRVAEGLVRVTRKRGMFSVRYCRRERLDGSQALLYPGRAKPAAFG